MAEDGAEGRRGDVRGGRAAALADTGWALRWRCVGPHRGGRVVAVAGDPVDPMVFYFGACAGGVWKTTDGGTYWENVSDGFFKTAAVGALAVAPSDPNVIYAGTGETTIRGNVSHGDGVYRSTDGGKTWAHLGLEDTRHIARIRVHPGDPDTVYVAALGHAWGPNDERGLYRSRDGGHTWERVLSRGDRAGAIDLSMDPGNPRVLFAAFWEAMRSPYGLSSGGPGSGLFRSTDGGDTWVELTAKPGLPTGVKGKIGVAVSPARPDRVWALVEALDGALFRSDDRGETWERMSEDPELRKRAWYYMHLYVDPQDAETVWVLNLQCWKSNDGGRSFASVPTPHGDNHDLWIDPRDTRRMIEGNDGGACVSFNGGRSWSSIYNQPTAQMYHVTTDTQQPYRIYGSQQDNSAIAIASMSVNGAITEQDWYEPGGGESGYIAVRPDDPNIVFGGGIGSGPFNGRLLRYDRRTGQQRDITVWPRDQGMGEGAASLRYRFQWTFPLSISPHDPTVLYVAANRLLRSTDEGASWEETSPDLTRNDPSTHGPSGGPITKDNTGAEVYGTIFACVESPHERGVLWAGSDDGLVHISRDGGQTWDNVTPPELPDWALITTIEVSPRDPAAAYLCATRYKHDDTTPYLFKTEDYGRTWMRISAGIPDGEFTRVLRADSGCPGLLFAGTETGLHVSFDDGESWGRMQGNLPVAPIYDLEVRGGDLIAATHGRSFWVLDDLTALRRLTERDVSSQPVLFPPRPATRIKVYEGFGHKPGPGVNYRHVGTLVAAFLPGKTPEGTPEHRWLDAGTNPPNGAVVNYYLPATPDGEVTLTFVTDDGTEIVTFSSAEAPSRPSSDDRGIPADEMTESGEGEEAAEVAGQAESAGMPRVPAVQGLNRFDWNMRYPDARMVPGDRTAERFAGPVALPGRYEVRLTVDGETLTAPLEIVADPAVSVSADDLRAQFDLAIRVRDTLSAVHDAVNCVRDLVRQIEGWQAVLARGNAGDEIAEEIVELKDRLRGIEDELIQRDVASPLNPPSRLNFKLGSLLTGVQFADAPPTRGQYGVFEELSAQVNEQLSRLSTVIAQDLPRVNARIRDSGVPAIVPPS